MHRIFFWNFIFIFLIFSNAVKSQNLKDYGVVAWTPQTELTWDDLNGISIPDSLNWIYLDVYLRQNTSDLSGFFIVEDNRYKAYFYSNTSFVHTEYQTLEVLEFINVYFDLVGVYAEKLNRLQFDMNNDQLTFNDRNVATNAMIKEWQEYSRRLINECEYGVNYEATLYWKDLVSEWMKNISVPFFERSRYSVGFDFSIALPMASYTAESYLSNSLGGILSAEFGFRPWMLGVGISGGGHTVEKDILLEGEQFIAQSQPNTLHLNIQGGYYLLDNQRIRLMPRIGFHTTNLRYPSNSPNNGSEWSYQWMTGLTSDFKIVRWSPRFNNELPLSDLSLRLGVYYYPIYYDELDFSTTYLTLGLALNIGGGGYKYEK